MAANEAAVQQQAMPPEERAAAVSKAACAAGYCPDADPAEGWEPRIAAAIRGAVAEEREACAKLAEETGEHYEDSEDRYLAWGWGDAQEAIAAAIRSR